MANDLSESIAAVETFLRGEGVHVARDEPMARHSSFSIGGPADLYVSAISVDDLVSALQGARDYVVPIMVVGGCTNLLWGDRGFRGLVIRNQCTGQHMSTMERQDSTNQTQFGAAATATLMVEAGVNLSALARRVSLQGWGGLAWAVGIPGTVGGAIVNNAGAFGACTADAVLSVNWVNRQGERGSYSANAMGFGYRTSRLKGSRDWVVVSALLSVRREDCGRLKELVRECAERRRATQPQGASAGSVFKNPAGDFAGRLIEEAGLKGRRVGSACISEKHANFILNEGGANAKDVRALIDLVQEEVMRRSGVALELEIELVGEA